MKRENRVFWHGAALTVLCQCVAGLEFLAMGDWGGMAFPPYYTPDEKFTAKTMGEVASAYNAEFVLALGDNFYHTGVKNVQDKRFQETFEDVFTAESLLDIPFYVLAGNHDHYGNVSAEIAYTNISPNQRWQFPDYYYTQLVSIPTDGGANLTLQLIMLDTVILCGGTVDPHDVDALRACRSYYSVHASSDTNFWSQQDQCAAQPQGALDPQAASEEWEFINETLAASTADYIIVAGHYPIWSVAEHGPTQELVDKLRPLLLQYDVTLYMNGHDHTMEYIEETDNENLGYVTTGAAHVCDYSDEHKNDVPDGSLLYHECRLGGFVRVSVDSEGLTVFYYMGDANNITYTTKTFEPRSQGQAMQSKLY